MPSTRLSVTVNRLEIIKSVVKEFVKKREYDRIGLIVFGDNAYSIEDQSVCDELETGMIVVVRLTSSWGRQKLAGAPVLLAEDAKPKLVDAINAEFDKYREEDADAEIATFLSENTHLLIAKALELA